jgi:hypothetical protein
MQFYSLKYDTNCFSNSACEFNSSEAAAVSSETAELLCTTCDTCESPMLTCAIASACSLGCLSDKALDLLQIR